MRCASHKAACIAASIALAASFAAAATASASASTPTKHGTPGVSARHVCTTAPAPGTATCYALRVQRKAVRHVAPGATPSGYGPSDLASAYNLPSGGSGETVGIVDAYDDPNAESDLATYRSQYGLPACTTANGCFKKVNQNGVQGSYPSGNTGWAGEISLDIQMVSAVCPSCNILLVEANSASMANLGTAVNTAVSLGAKFVSNSYGGGESSGETSYDSSYYHHSGVAVVASTGDDGYGISYPAASPYVTAVGGTSLTRSSTARGWTETAWSDAGSGCSSYEAKPSWQNVTTGCSRRANADVSAVADPNTGVAVYQTYGASGWVVYGGTSVSSPIIASVYALAGTPGSSDTPASYPYADPGALNDVTSGSNGSCSPSELCKAGVGWDGPTGLGTPNGVAAFSANGGGGGSSPVTVTNPGNQTNTVGDSVSLQMSASGGTPPYTWSATGLPNGLTINASSGLISGSPSTSGTFSVTVTATDSASSSGQASFSWKINAAGGSCSGQLLGNPGFETGSAAPWTASSGVISDTADGGVAHSGDWYAWLDGYGRKHTDTLKQTVTIPAGCSASLSYWLYISTQERGSHAYDTLTVKIGSTTVASYSNANANDEYVQYSVDLSKYAGKTVTLTFTGTEDRSLATSFLIDDTAINLS